MCTHSVSDFVEDGRHIAHVVDVERWVEHLALAAVLFALSMVSYICVKLTLLVLTRRGDQSGPKCISVHSSTLVSPDGANLTEKQTTHFT